jgi:hypothetical protein
MVVLLLVISLFFSQSIDHSQSVDQKSQQIIDQAVEAMGGQK